MRKILTSLFLIASFFMYSQSGYKYLSLGYGYSVDEVQQFNVALELNNGNYNAWDIVFEGQRNLITNEEIFRMGAIYEPLLAKKRNFLLNFRVGGLFGTNGRLFVLGPVAGFEASYSFSGLFTVFLQQNNHYIINVDERFRHALLLGIKIPF